MALRTAAGAAALAIALGVSGQGLAQTTPGQQTPKPQKTEAPKAPVAGQIVAQEADTILADRDFIGQTVYAADKSKIGTISDLILSKDGQSVRGFVIGVGGFLGIGEKNVAIDPSAFQPVADSNANDPNDMKLKVTWTKDQLKNAPSFEYYKAPARTTSSGAGPNTGMSPRPTTPAR
jgi:sporulation protein YlmC with PRC-barrel domain